MSSTGVVHHRKYKCAAPKGLDRPMMMGLLKTEMAGHNHVQIHYTIL